MARGEIHVQLTVNFPEDAKVRALVRFGRDARPCRDLYVQMLLYCKKNLTDGFVPVEEIGILVFPDTPKAGVKDADRLAEVGLIERVEGGYQLPGFLKRNKSKAQVEAESKTKAEAGRKGGKQSGLVRRGEAEQKHSASGGEAESKQGASECLNTETEVIGHRSVPVPAEPCADAPGEDLVLVVVETKKPPAKSRKGRKVDRTPLDDQADELTNGYWERYATGQAQKWIAVRGIVLTALKNGAHRNQVAWALVLIGDQGKPVTGPILTIALGVIRKAQAQGQPEGATAAEVSRRQQETNDMFARALARAQARDAQEAS